MNTPIALGGSLLAVLIWLISRRRPSAAAPRQVATPAAIARQIESAAVAEPPCADQGSVAQPAPLPRTRQQRLLQWTAALASSQEQRLAAVQQMAAAADRSCLPLLRRSLRDPHPPVVLAAAQAIARYRGRTAALGSAASSAAAKLPRNAAPRCVAS